MVPLLRQKYEAEKLDPSNWTKPSTGGPAVNRAALFESGGYHGRYEAPLPGELVSTQPTFTSSFATATNSRASVLESGGYHARYEQPLTPKAREEPKAAPAPASLTSAFEAGGYHARYELPGCESRCGRVVGSSALRLQRLTAKRC